jgi:hypothetical protein
VAREVGAKLIAIGAELIGNSREKNPDRHRARASDPFESNAAHYFTVFGLGELASTNRARRLGLVVAFYIYSTIMLSIHHERLRHKRSLQRAEFLTYAPSKAMAGALGRNEASAAVECLAGAASRSEGHRLWT